MLGHYLDLWAVDDSRASCTQVAFQMAMGEATHMESEYIAIA